MGTSIIIALIGLLSLVHRVRKLRIPRQADFFTTLRMVPLSLVILLDLLDFGLDIFSAPFIWVILNHMGLSNLRNKATIEALIPISGPIPTFTICWIVARMFDLGEPIASYRPIYPRRRPHSGVSTTHDRNLLDVDNDNY